MRPASEMPRRRSINRGRVVAVAALVAFIVLVTSLRGIARFYTDYLWFDSLNLTSVWRGVLGAKIVLALVFTGVFFALLLANLIIADRLAPRFRPAGPEEDLLERYHELVGARSGLVRAGVAFLFALIMGVGVSGQWNAWILYNNRVDFGITDPQFGRDIGFYVFELPLLSYVASWLFAALVMVLIVTGVAHYLNGGIRLNTTGQRVTPAVKGHLSVLLGVLALVRAWDYYLDQFGLTSSTRGAVRGATYTDVNAQLPALKLLILISLFSFLLFIYNIWRRGWVLPALAVSLWAFVAITVGGIYPAFVQRFRVEPAESSREEEFIARNIESTRMAFGLDDVQVQRFEYTPNLSADDLLDNEVTIRNIRLLDPQIVNDTFERLQAERGFYTFGNELDVDRYVIDGEVTQVVLAARELDVDGIPNKSWEGEHVAFTHGYGLALSAANAVTSDGRPDFLVSGIPVDVDSSLPADLLDQPRLYYGEDLKGYAIIETSRREIDFQDADGNTQENQYDGDGGVGIGGFIRESAFALRFGQLDPLISDFLGSDSRVIFNRDVRTRVETLAPFLRYDSDPYPVVSEGRIVYVIDAYTISNDYPYAESALNSEVQGPSGLRGGFNYVRNSVKAVVDTFNGDVTFFIMDSEDPMIQAYSKAFPELFTDLDAMPADLQAHLRYPEDLFRVQTNMWARYQLDQPVDFLEQAGAWAVAQDPGETVSGAQTVTLVTDAGETRSQERRIDPTYLLMRLPDRSDEDFLILRSFVPLDDTDQRKELTAFMVGLSDPEDYGKLIVYETPTNVQGPSIVNANILNEPEISARITLLSQQGSKVLFGDMLLVPIENSILYVRTLYVAAEGSTQNPELTNVIVALGDEVVMGETLRDALVQLFGEAPETREEDGQGQVLVPGTGDEPDAGTEEEPEPPPPEEVPNDVAGLLERAEEEFLLAEQALIDGDLGEYQRRVQEAARWIRLARERMGEEAPDSTTTTTAAPGEA
ncbi:MAG: UPF0182 family protein [Actinomycetia bacterium]|nr:UPF0182 family protein [Actinomycetes bacterium]